MQPKSRWRPERHAVAPLLLGLVLSAAVCWPWASDGGRLLLLDWVIGPHHDLLSRSAHGLDGGVTSGVPLQALVGALNAAIGAWATWLPIAVFFPLAATGAARLCRAGGAALPGCLAAAVLFCVNPMVFDRIGAGQIAFLLGYSLLPHALVALLHGADRGWRGGFVPGLWIAALVACTSHYAWIVTVLVVAFVLSMRFKIRLLGCVAVAALVTAASSIYLLIGPAVGSHQISASAGADLVAYRTTGASALDRVVHVVGLYGFWREVPYEPRTVLSGWWLLLLLLLIVATIGYVDRLRRGPSGLRAMAAALLLAMVAGVLLALGDQGP
ncbi:MAG: hypothetical protein QOJ03_1600, partial [Frankiaceae bacterium]|nr:hypothetical protein [Frankiaceae bacterium]